MPSAARTPATASTAVFRADSTSTTAATVWTLLALLALTLALRAPGLTRPLVGHFATKHCVYAMIAGNFAADESTWMHPTLNVLSTPSMGTLPQPTWHMVELPLSAYLSGALWQVCGGELAVWGRVTSLAWSLLSVAGIYFLVRQWHGQRVATVAALALAVSPVSIVFGQAFMLEASVVALTIGTIAAWERWLSGARWWWLCAGMLLFAALLLTKIYMLVLLLPLVERCWSAHQEQRARARRLVPAACALLLAVLPAAAWYLHAWEVAAPGTATAERVFFSVRNSAATHGGSHTLLLSADFYRQLLDDLAGPVLTPIGFVLLLLGCLHPRARQSAAWLISMGVLIVALPLKFYEMNYYWLVVLPPCCVLIGLGFELIWQRLPRRRAACLMLLGVTLLFSLRYAARPAWETPREDQQVMAAAAMLRQHAAADDRVVTLHGTTLDLLYYCGRDGWAVSPRDARLNEKLQRYQELGARWLVVVDEDFGTRAQMAAWGEHWSPVLNANGYALWETAASSDRRQTPPTQKMPAAPGTR